MLPLDNHYRLLTHFSTLGPDGPIRDREFSRHRKLSPHCIAKSADVMAVAAAELLPLWSVMKGGLWKKRKWSAAVSMAAGQRYMGLSAAGE